MNPIEVTVVRKGTKARAEDDAVRLDMVLDEDNNYSAQYNAVWVHTHGIDCYCVRESDNKLVIAKIGEIIVRTLPTVV